MAESVNLKKHELEDDNFDLRIAEVKLESVNLTEICSKALFL